MGQIVRDEGGVIVPMFNEFIDATGPKVGGWVKDGNQRDDGRLRAVQVLADRLTNRSEALPEKVERGSRRKLL